jgi:hypothetical protein
LVPNQTSSSSWQQSLEMPRKTFWARLPFGVRMSIAGLGVLSVVAGAAGGIAALTGRDEPRPGSGAAAVSAPLDIPAEPRTGTGMPRAAAAGVPGAAAPRAAAGAPKPRAGADGTGDRSQAQQADRTATRAPRTAAGAPEAPTAGAPDTGAVTRVEQVSETQTIPFRTTMVRDPALPRGAKEVRSQGIPGERVLRYDVTYVDGRETGRRLAGSTVTREPQDRVIAYGNRRWTGGGGDRDFGDGGGRGGPGWGHGRPRDPRGPRFDQRDDAGNEIGIGNGGRRFGGAARSGDRWRGNGGDGSYRSGNRVSGRQAVCPDEAVPAEPQQRGVLPGKRTTPADAQKRGVLPGKRTTPADAQQRGVLPGERTTPAGEQPPDPKLGLLTDDGVTAADVTMPCGERPDNPAASENESPAAPKPGQTAPSWSASTN